MTGDLFPPLVVQLLVALGAAALLFLVVLALAAVVPQSALIAGLVALAGAELYRRGGRA